MRLDVVGCCTVEGCGGMRRDEREKQNRPRKHGVSTVIFPVESELELILKKVLFWHNLIITYYLRGDIKGAQLILELASSRTTIPSLGSGNRRCSGDGSVAGVEAWRALSSSFVRH